jgi:predicted transposase YbfD/YdcC
MPVRASHPAPRIAVAFAELTDPRDGPALKHGLLDLLTIAFCAILCGEEDWVGVEEWALVREEVLTDWLGLPHGVPSHDTFGRVFARLDPAQFEGGFARWVREALPDRPDGEVIAIDGKTARRSGDARSAQSPLHLVSAFACEQRLVLGQEAVAGKSNEITAIPLLLERLVLADHVVTIDAIGCQRSLAARIVAQGGDYVLALKENQETLLEGVMDTFRLADRETEAPPVQAVTIDKGHGRLEHRRCDVIADPDVLAWLDPARDWPGLQCVVRITATRAVANDEAAAPTTSVRYYLSSLPPDAVRLNAVIRSHWAIENGLHWVLDVVFREDASRARRGYAQQNLALLRKLALNVVRTDPGRGTRSLRIQRKRAGWSMAILYDMLGVS